MTLPIRARLTAWYTLFLAATLVGLGAFLVIELRTDLRSTVDRQVRTGSGAIAQNYQVDGLTGFRQTSAAALRRSGSAAQVLSAGGQVIAEYGDVAHAPMISRKREDLALTGRLDLIDVRLGQARQRFRLLATPVVARTGPQLVVVAVPLQGVVEAVDRILNLLLIAGPVAMVVAGIAVSKPDFGANAAESQVERGKYLVTLGGCMDCHTPGYFLGKPDMGRYLGGSDVGFEIPGMGTFYGRNLTPDAQTGLGNWTTQDIVTALQAGTRPDGRQLAPIMPWRAFASLTKEDAQAIAAYLKSLPPVTNKVLGPYGPSEKPASFVMKVVPPEQKSASAK